MKVRLPKSPGGQDMSSVLRQAQKMQEEMQEKQAELEEQEYEVSAGGGVVKVKIDGKRKIRSIELSPEIVDPDDIETLTDILVAAVNEAIGKVDDVAQEEMSKITGSLGMPGLF